MSKTKVPAPMELQSDLEGMDGRQRDRAGSGSKKHTSEWHHVTDGKKCYRERSRKGRTEWGWELDTVNRGVTEGFELGDKEASWT